MKKATLTETEKVEIGEEQSQEHAHNFDIKRTVHKERICPACKTVNSAYYCGVYGDCMKMCEDFSSILRHKNWPLHHDDALSHTSFFSRKFFTKNKMTIIYHPPHLPDLGPCNFPFPC
jgi:hypothetical protein